MKKKKERRLDGIKDEIKKKKRKKKESYRRFGTKLSVTFRDDFSHTVHKIPNGLNQTV
jgi:hypothetical protein